MNDKINIGSIYQTNNYGNVKVLGNSQKYGYYIVEFQDTKTIKDFKGWQIIEGCIRDPYAKKVCNVACTGNIKTKGKYKPYYSVWHDMINRCYNTENKRFTAYENVSVCDEWLIFENFYNDCNKIDGYNETLFNASMLVLDKDIKQRFQTKKIYSANTCKWVLKSENNEIQDAQQKTFFAMSPEGVIYKDYNITRFSREHNLQRSGIQKALRGIVKQTHGWRFSYEEIV